MNLEMLDKRLSKIEVEVMFISDYIKELRNEYETVRNSQQGHYRK